MNLYHYVYLILQEGTRNFYIGVRSSQNPPEVDKYMGSMKTWRRERDFNKYPKIKRIIKTFNSREEAELYEAKLITKYVVHPLNKNYSIPKGRACLA